MEYSRRFAEEVLLNMKNNTKVFLYKTIKLKFCTKLNLQLGFKNKLEYFILLLAMVLLMWSEIR